MSGGSTRLIDGEGKLAGVTGNPLDVDSPDFRELLQAVLKELKIANQYLSELAGLYIDTEE